MLGAVTNVNRQTILFLSSSNQIIPKSYLIVEWRVVVASHMPSRPPAFKKVVFMVFNLYGDIVSVNRSSLITKFG